MKNGGTNMDKVNVKALQKTMLFKGMTEDEMTDALDAMQARVRTCQKGEIILYAGAVTNVMGLVLEGSVNIESNDMWGNRTLLSHVGRGQFFAESYALLEGEPLLVDAVANEKSRVLMLQVSNLAGRFQNSWTFKLLKNLVTIASRKNLTLSARIFHTAPKTVRGRVMAYLNAVALQKQQREFDIPFDRQQLADYLNLDRSALSKELGKMQKEGIITFHKNHFCIIASEE